MKTLAKTWWNFFLLSLAWAQTTVLLDGTTNAGSFEGAGASCATGTATYQGWTIVNGTESNRWVVNTAAGAQHGSQAIYITNNCGGSPPPHQYDRNASSVVHVYRDVTLPAGQPALTVSAYIKVSGEPCCDYLDLFVAPTSVTPVAGAEVGSAYRIGRYSRLPAGWNLVSASFCGTAGTTYRVIFSWRNDDALESQPPAALDRVRIVASATPPGVFNVPALPYTHGADDICGKGNKFTTGNSSACGSDYGGEDMLWAFTPAVSGVVTVTIASVASNAEVKVYRAGGPFQPCAGLPGATCLAYDGTSASNRTLNVCVAAGQTYYVVVDHPNPLQCSAFANLTISEPAAPTGIVSVDSVPYTHGPGTTCGQGNKFTRVSVPVCGSASYYNGEDLLWTYTPSANGTITASLSSSASGMGLMVYRGGTLRGCELTGATCVRHDQTSANPKTITINVQAGQPYYFLVDGPRAAPLMILRLRFWLLRWVGRRGWGLFEYRLPPLRTCCSLLFLRVRWRPCIWLCMMRSGGQSIRKRWRDG